VVVGDGTVIESAADEVAIGELATVAKSDVRYS
jgi:hypothetical protein